MKKEIIIDGIEYIRKDQTAAGVVLNADAIFLIRTYSAGVHFGELVSRNGKEVELKNARRLWSWKGACSLSQVAIDGVDTKESNISIVVPSILLTEAIEIIKMSEKSAKQMMEAPAWKK